MEIYSQLSQLQNMELQVIRHGFFMPQYILTDGQSSYGKLSSAGAFNRGKIIETADGTCSLQPAGILSRETLIYNSLTAELMGRTVAQNWSNKMSLEMNDGLNVSFSKTGGIFSWSTRWTSDKYGELMKIDSLFKYATPFKITFNEDILKTNIALLLIAIIGVNILLARQAQAAAH